MKDDLFDNEHVNGAVYLTDLGQYLVKIKGRGRAGTGQDTGCIAKSVRESVVAAAFRHITIDSGWLPAGILRVGTSSHGDWYVYDVPTGIRAIKFYDNKVFEVPMPHLLLIGADAKFYIFAYQAAKDYWQVTSKTMLYKAPLPNVHENGLICWGQNKAPKSTPDQANEAVKLFFTSGFNRDLSNEKSKSQPGNIRQLLESLDGKSEFPDEDLISYKEVERVIAEITR